MLLALELLLHSDNDATLPPSVARAAHAALLTAMSRVDAPLVRALHDHDGAVPLTCSNLRGATAHCSGLSVEKEHGYALRITALTAPVSDLLWETTARMQGQRLRLDSATFRVMARRCDGKRGTGRSDYATLNAMLDDAEAAPAVTLRFASPISFKSQGLLWPFPTPELLFGSLARRWQTFTDQPLPIEMQHEAASRIAISRYQMQSAAISTKGDGFRIGGTGVASYRVLDRHQTQLCATMQMLAAFGSFAGAGIGTTYGMGQLWRL